MNISDLLSRLQKVRQNGPSDWFAICPGHDDSNASLHITEDGGKILMRCFSCGDETVHRVCDKLCIREADLFTDSSRAPLPKYGCTIQEYASAKRLNIQLLASWGVVQGQYTSKGGKVHPGVFMPYKDTEGKMVAARWRMCMEKNTGQGNRDLRFLWDKGNKPCIYGLWRMGEFNKDYVLLVEGESDCHSLWHGGFQAMGLPGAGNYKPERDDKWLDRFDTIYAVIERDSGGKTLFQHLSSSEILRDKIRYFSVPGYKDSSDAWIHCKDLKEFQGAIQYGMDHADLAREYQQPEAWKTPEIQQDARAVTSAANGAKGGRPKIDLLGLTNDYASRLKDEQGRWIMRSWHENWWRHDGLRYRMLMDSDMEAEAMAYLQRPETEESFQATPSKNVLQNLLQNLKSTNYCAVKSEIQNNSWLPDGSEGRNSAVFGNGIVDIRQAALYAASLADIGADATAEPSEWQNFVSELTPDYLCTTAHEYAYDPSAQCPKFLQFLEDVAPDPRIKATIQMMFGACLTSECYDKAFIVFGEAGTGKSTLLKIMKMVVGQENCCHVPLLDLSEKFRLWPLSECLVNIVEELSTDDPLGKLRYIEADFKEQITGGMITVERKGKDVMILRCMAKHVFATNSLPTFFDKTSGIWDRIVIIPFMQVIRNTEKQVLNFAETLQDELSGILNWALTGLGMLLRNGGKFVEGEPCQQLKQEHRDRCDQDGVYIRDVFYADEYGEVTVSDAYKAYCAWLEAQGMARRTCPTFKLAMLRVLGIKESRRSTMDRTRIFKGISMMPSFIQHNVL